MSKTAGAWAWLQKHERHCKTMNMAAEAWAWLQKYEHDCKSIRIWLRKLEHDCRCMRMTADVCEWLQMHENDCRTMSMTAETWTSLQAQGHEHDCSSVSLNAGAWAWMHEQTHDCRSIILNAIAWAWLQRARCIISSRWGENQKRCGTKVATGLNIKTRHRIKLWWMWTKTKSKKARITKQLIYRMSCVYALYIFAGFISGSPADSNYSNGCDGWCENVYFWRHGDFYWPNMYDIHHNEPWLCWKSRITR